MGRKKQPKIEPPISKSNVLEELSKYVESCQSRKLITELVSDIEVKIEEYKIKCDLTKNETQDILNRFYVILKNDYSLEILSDKLRKNFEKKYN